MNMNALRYSAGAAADKGYRRASAADDALNNAASVGRPFAPGAGRAEPRRDQCANGGSLPETFGLCSNRVLQCGGRQKEPVDQAFSETDLMGE